MSKYVSKEFPVMVQWHHIEVTQTAPIRCRLAYLSWDQLPLPVGLKWHWYFRYRAALLQVQYPKAEVRHSWGNKPATGSKYEILMRDRLKNRIIAKKRKITETENKLQRARDNWTSIFPIEQDPLYPKVVAKLQLLRAELEELINSVDQVKAPEVAEVS